MKYLCMAFEQEAVLDALTAGEWAALRGETMEYVQRLRERGVLLHAEPLQSVRTASTVRVRGGKVSVIDGPFAETKETLGGFFLIDVPDLDAALAVAAQWPSARLGSIEVRPVEPGLAAESRYRSQAA